MAAWSLMLSEGWLPQMMMIGGAALAVMLILVNIRKRQSRGGAGRLSPREKIEQAKQTHAMRGDLRQMMVELEELTRRFSAQLDAKSVKIEKLIEEADEKITKLQQLQSEASEPAAPAPKSAKPARAKKTAPPKPAPPKPEPADQTPPVDPLAKQIYNLADSGQTSIQIAKRLDEQIGKVELILALRQ